MRASWRALWCLTAVLAGAALAEDPRASAAAADEARASLVAQLQPPDPSDKDDVAEASESVELEAASTGLPSDGSLLYSTDLSDDELTQRFREAPSSLGTISMGLAEAGRVINSAQLPAGEAWLLVDPSKAFGTQETLDSLMRVARDVQSSYPAAKLRINHLGKEGGGWLRPHQSHQSGRDADLGFYYREGVSPGAPTQTREKSIDLAMNWALVRSLIINADVQFILVDRRIQKVLYDYALAVGEKKVWLDKVFLGKDTLVKHCRGHRDHFHVRFFAPRSQELGRRLQPLLAAHTDENVVIHRVVKGDSLGKLAATFSSTVKLIQGANGLKSSALSVGRTLNIPVRGPCTKCPLPAPLVVPPRLLPPEPDPKS
jgi:murein endopeptidase